MQYIENILQIQDNMSGCGDYDISVWIYMISGNGI